MRLSKTKKFSKKELRKVLKTLERGDFVSTNTYLDSIDYSDAMFKSKRTIDNLRSEAWKICYQIRFRISIDSAVEQVNILLNGVKNEEKFYYTIIDDNRSRTIIQGKANSIIRKIKELGDKIFDYDSINILDNTIPSGRSGRQYSYRLSQFGKKEYRINNILDFIETKAKLNIIK